MKYTAIFLAMIALLAATPAFAAGPPEVEEPPNWTITVDPLTVALGYPHIQIERRINSSLSVYAGPHARLFDSIFEEGSESFYGLGAEAAVRWFPFGSAPSGFWLSARTVAAHLKTYDVMDPTSSFGGYSSGLAGFTWIPFNWLVLSGGAGVQYLYYDIEDLGLRTLYPAMHTAVGIAF